MNIDNLNKETSNETDDRYSENDILVAYRALKNGRATPKQQKIVYKEHQKEIKKNAKKQKSTPFTRNLMIYGTLNNHPEGKKEKKKDIFKEIAEKDHISSETVEREYAKFKVNYSDEDIKKVFERMINALNKPLKSANEKKYKL